VWHLASIYCEMQSVLLFIAIMSSNVLKLAVIFSWLHVLRADYNLSMESNQNVESKWESVEYKMGKCGVQLLTYLLFDPMSCSFECYVETRVNRLVFILYPCSVLMLFNSYIVVSCAWQLQMNEYFWWWWWWFGKNAINIDILTHLKMP